MYHISVSVIIRDNKLLYDVYSRLRAIPLYASLGLQNSYLDNIVYAYPLPMDEACLEEGEVEGELWQV